MRYYGFGNYYLSSLQQGLQAAHVIADLFGKYANTDDANDLLSTTIEWADDHKTIILLNGGNSADLKELVEFFDSLDNPYPYTSFSEDMQSLNCALTSVGIVLPAKIYETAERDRRFKSVRTADENGHVPELTPWEEELIVRLNSYSLAK